MNINLRAVCANCNFWGATPPESLDILSQEKRRCHQVGADLFTGPDDSCICFSALPEGVLGRG